MTATTREPSFQRLQQALASHLREPESCPAPDGADGERIAVYRRLFFKNVAGFIGRAFPVLRQLYNRNDWQRLVRHFYAHHHCQTPYFRRIPKEFVDYLAKERGQQKGDPPFLHELAHYEWIELSLSIAKEPAQKKMVDAEGDLLSGRPVLTPLIRRLTYSWPVHKIRTGFQPQQPSLQPYYYLVYRDRDYRVRFLHVGQVSSLLVNNIKTHPRHSGQEHVRAALRQSVFAADHADASDLIEQGRQLLGRLREKDILLGVLKPQR